MKLIHDPGPIFILPLPALLQESIPSQISFVNTFFFQLVYDLDLGGNGCMVRSGLPQRLISLHSLITDQYILHGVIQGMSHMKLACDIGRGHNNGKGLFAAVHLCMEIFSF